MRTLALLLACLASAGFAAQSTVNGSPFSSLGNMLRNGAAKKNVDMLKKNVDTESTPSETEEKPSETEDVDEAETTMANSDSEARAKAKLEAMYGKEFVDKLEVQMEAIRTFQEREAAAKAELLEKFGPEIVAKLEEQFEAQAQKEREAAARAELEKRLGKDFVTKLEADLRAKEQAKLPIIEETPIIEEDVAEQATLGEDSPKAALAQLLLALN